MKTTPLALESDMPRRPVRPRRLARAARGVSAGVLALAAAGSVATATAPAANATDYCKVVTADSLTIFRSASSDDNVFGVWGRGTVFYVDRTDPPKNRYHVSFYNLWVSSDPRWTNPC